MQTPVRALVALLVVGIAMAVVFLAFNAVVPALADKIAPLVGGAYPSVYKALGTSKFRLTFSIVPDHLAPLSGFSLPWYTLFLAASFLKPAAISALGFLTGSILLFSQIQPNFANTYVAGVLSSVAVGLLVGRWIGTRSNRFGIATTIAATLAGGVILLPLELAFIPVDYWQAFGYSGKGDVVIRALTSSVIAIPIALAGYWWGRRAQTAAYTSYLLGSVSAESRRALVELAYEEAQRPHNHGPVAEQC